MSGPPPSVEFRHHGSLHRLAGGAHYAAPRENGFRDTSAADLIALVAEITAGRPWREAVAARYRAERNWLYRIVTADSRTSFLDAVLPADDRLALDLGAGWGQIARPLAKQRPVVALEPVAERLAFIKAAARQDGVHDRIAYLAADYLDVDFATRFGAICVIGVLEWAGTFQAAGDPQAQQRDFLRKTRRDLAPGGTLVIGIENRLGLKYLLGCPDDHLGRPFVASLPAPLARERWRDQTGAELRSFTYSQAEMDMLLRDAGYEEIEFFAAFPDYKLPEWIVPLADQGAALRQRFAQERSPREHNGFDGSPLAGPLQAMLDRHYAGLPDDGALPFFVPSYFVRAR